MAAPSTTTTGSDSTSADGKRFVALCTGATGISSVHLIRHLQQDPRFTKIYGVSRRDLYDVDTTHVEHVKLDLLDSQKVKEELKSKGVSDGGYWSVFAGNVATRMQHAALTPLLLVCSHSLVPGEPHQAQFCLPMVMLVVTLPNHTLPSLSAHSSACPV